MPRITLSSGRARGDLSPNFRKIYPRKHLPKVSAATRHPLMRQKNIVRRQCACIFIAMYRQQRNWLDSMDARHQDCKQTAAFLAEAMKSLSEIFVLIHG